MKFEERVPAQTMMFWSTKSIRHDQIECPPWFVRGRSSRPHEFSFEGDRNVAGPAYESDGGLHVVQIAGTG